MGLRGLATSEEDSALSNGQIVGVAIGSILVFGGLLFTIVYIVANYFSRKRWRSNSTHIKPRRWFTRNSMSNGDEIELKGGFSISDDAPENGSICITAGVTDPRLTLEDPTLVDAEAMAVYETIETSRFVDDNGVAISNDTSLAVVATDVDECGVRADGVQEERDEAFIAAFHASGEETKWDTAGATEGITAGTIESAGESSVRVEDVAINDSEETRNNDTDYELDEDSQITDNDEMEGADDDRDSVQSDDDVEKDAGTESVRDMDALRSENSQRENGDDIFEQMNTDVEENEEDDAQVADDDEMEARDDARDNDPGQEETNTTQLKYVSDSAPTTITEEAGAKSAIITEARTATATPATNTAATLAATTEETLNVNASAVRSFDGKKHTQNDQQITLDNTTAKESTGEVDHKDPILIEDGGMQDTPSDELVAEGLCLKEEHCSNDNREHTEGGGGGSAVSCEPTETRQAQTSQETDSLNHSRSVSQDSDNSSGGATDTSIPEKQMMLDNEVNIDGANRKRNSNASSDKSAGLRSRITTSDESVPVSPRDSPSSVDPCESFEPTSSRYSASSASSISSVSTSTRPDIQVTDRSTTTTSSPPAGAPLVPV